MDEIVTFLNDFSNRYPKNWLKFDDYVSDFLPKDNINSFTFKSSYLKSHYCHSTKDGIKYLPKEKANDGDIEKSLRLFDLEMIDYEDVFNDFDENYFDIENWCSERLEFELKLIREFLFECSVFKGRYFINSLFRELAEIENNLDNLWTLFKPNWIQDRITKELKISIGYLKEEIIEDFSSIYSNNSALPFINNSNNVDDIILKAESKAEDTIWYKIAQLMADGTIVITNRLDYLFKGEPAKSEMEMSRLISKHLAGAIKDTSIKPYLNMTKSCIEDNKNIFIKSRIKELTLIASIAEKNGNLNDFYRRKLESLTTQN